VRLALWLVFAVGCSPRFGAMSGTKSACTSAGWYIDGPEQVAVYREVTFRVIKCDNTGSTGRVIWTVSDGTVLRIVSQSNTSVRIKALKYGVSEVSAMGPSGQYGVSVTVE
jgi:hypothetical protein